MQQKQINECDNCKPRLHTEAGKLRVCSKTCHRNRQMSVITVNQGNIMKQENYMYVAETDK